MFRWLSLPFLLYPYFRWKALFGHGGAGFRLFVVCLRGLSPFSTRLQLVECGDGSLPLDLFMQTNLRGQTGFSDIFNFGFNNSFEQGKKPRIYFRRCVKCFFPIQIPWCGTCHVYRTTACCRHVYRITCLLLAWIFRSVLESALTRSCSPCAQTSGIFVVVIPAHGRVLE